MGDRPGTSRLVLKLFCCLLMLSLGTAQVSAQAPSPPPGAPPPDVKPYDPQLLRLAEVLGALSYLRGLCGDGDGDVWHKRMQALLDAEGTTPIRKDRLAGSYNRGIDGYSLSYRSCTPNARAVVERFLAEASQIARQVENRFGAS